jgi:hypothetical protein
MRLHIHNWVVLVSRLDAFKLSTAWKLAIGCLRCFNVHHVNTRPPPKFPQFTNSLIAIRIRASTFSTSCSEPMTYRLYQNPSKPQLTQSSGTFSRLNLIRRYLRSLRVVVAPPVPANNKILHQGQKCAHGCPWRATEAGCRG